MSAPVALSGASLLRRRIAGVAFLVVIGLLVWLTVLLYQKAFTPIVNVSLQTNRVGNQLSEQADVKVRGVVVGSVRSIRADGDGATIGLALDPDKVKLVPQDVVARLLPKTLFGEKYVELIVPAASAVPHLREGDVIPQDRSSTALETEEVLDNLLPLLQSLKPQQLSLTLNALSTALRDRGDRLGSTLADAGAYFTALNPALPTLGEDFRGLADFANSTAVAVPSLLTVLDNFSATSRSLVEVRPQLDRFLTSTTGFAASARSLVADNERRLIALANDALPSLNLFARYAPSFPCLLEGLADYHPIVARTFGGGQPGLHITLEATRDNGGYAPGQEPEYNENRGPSCWGLPKPPVPAGDDKFDDGYRTETSPSPESLVQLLLGPVASGNTVVLS